MDARRYREHLRVSAGRMSWWRKQPEEELVEVQLRGRAPWGFTLRGGTEHREPLVITKVELLPESLQVEQGSVAAGVRLRAGDEMVSVNGVPLSGSRQEAIGLVKSSHQTLTLVVRSKNRFRGKTDPGSRPHSWHSSKLTEEESDPAGAEAIPAEIWQPKHEARPKDSSGYGDQKTQHQESCRPGPVSSMERLERPSHPAPPGRLSPAKYMGSAEQLSGNKRDSGFSCFSGGSSPPASARRGTSSENIFFKGLQSDGAQPAERPRYLQTSLGNGGWDGSLAEDQPGPQGPPTGRPGVGPVWQVPEKKKSQSPPPPPPPLRSDSFAATKVFPYSDGPSGPANHGRSFEKLSRSQNQLHPNKLFSLSSSDVRQSTHAPPAHQRQYSDESPFYLQTRTAPPTKTQSVGSYYRSLQDLPTNPFSRKHVRHSTASMANPGLDGGGLGRYPGLAGKHPVHAAEHKARRWLSSSEAGFQRAKYLAPQSQTPHGENKERLGNGLHFDPQTYEVPVRSHSPEDQKRAEGHSHDVKRLFPIQPSGDHEVSLRLQDPWVPQEDHRISPLKTPLLHSLAQESRRLAERLPAAPPASAASPQDAAETMATSGGKANRRSDRYATTLRKEIQQKRAQLQKSRSAATLTCDAEEAEEWPSMQASASSGFSFSDTYKDHLKEAQARVLQATSFQRRDLEPLGPEMGHRSSNDRVRGRKRFHPAKRMHSFSEPDKMDTVGVEGDTQTGSEEPKPAFSSPALRPCHTKNLNTDPEDPSNPKERTPNWTPQPPAGPPSHLSPGRHPVSLEQQRLETFAEYQATWNKQKKSPEAKGRYHSAENILDAGAEEKTVCIHERSRSSPSADFYTQNIQCPWRDPQSQQSSSSRMKAESRLSDDSPQLVPGPPDHRPRPDTASHTQPTPPPGHRSVSPGLGSSRPAQPPPRPLLGPETPSSQEFPTGSQSEPVGLRPRPGSPRSRPEEDPAPPPAALPLPGTDGGRSPSPQFAPPRLTDKPPAVSTRDGSALRSEEEPSAVMEVSGAVRKVPVRIVHAEDSSERGGRAYLPQSSEACSVTESPPCISSLGGAEWPSSSLFSAYTRQAAPGCESRGGGGSRHLEEDAKREELARDIMGKDKSLVDILDQSGRKTTMDLMEGLFLPEEKVLEGAQQRRRASAGSRLPTLSPRTNNRREEEEVSASAAASLVPSSSYYNTSAPKAELLIKMKDMQEQLEEQDSDDELDIDLASKKQQLISSLASKLGVLREARQSLQEDVDDNEALGREVEATVQRLCQPNQLDKFRMFVGDLDKVVSLLLSLSGRLARVENALNSLEEEAPPEEKRTLTEKRKLLMRQHEDAKELKENLDRREQLVSGIMEVHLDAASLDDYRHFVKMKSALIIEQRKLEDKIKLGDEQLKGLMDSLPLEQRTLL